MPLQSGKTNLTHEVTDISSMYCAVLRYHVKRFYMVSVHSKFNESWCFIAFVEFMRAHVFTGLPVTLLDLIHKSRYDTTNNRARQPRILGTSIFISNKRNIIFIYSELPTERLFPTPPPKWTL